jgi:hypothetical protein
MDIKGLITLGPGSTVAEHTTHDSMIEGSNPGPGTGREKMAESYRVKIC